MQLNGLKIEVVSLTKDNDFKHITCEGIADNSNILLVLSSIDDLIVLNVKFIRLDFTKLKYADRHLILLLKNYMEYFIWTGGEIIIENAPKCIIDDIQALGQLAYFDIKNSINGNAIKINKLLTVKKDINIRIEELKNKISEKII